MGHLARPGGKWDRPAHPRPEGARGEGLAENGLERAEGEPEGNDQSGPSVGGLSVAINDQVPDCALFALSLPAMCRESFS